MSRQPAPQNLEEILAAMQTPLQSPPTEVPDGFDSAFIDGEYVSVPQQLDAQEITDQDWANGTNNLVGSLALLLLASPAMRGISTTAGATSRLGGLTSLFGKNASRKTAATRARTARNARPQFSTSDDIVQMSNRAAQSGNVQAAQRAHNALGSAQTAKNLKAAQQRAAQRGANANRRRAVTDRTGANKTAPNAAPNAAAPNAAAPGSRSFMQKLGAPISAFGRNLRTRPLRTILGTAATGAGLTALLTGGGGNKNSEEFEVVVPEQPTETNNQPLTPKEEMQQMVMEAMRQNLTGGSSGGTDPMEMLRYIREMRAEERASRAAEAEANKPRGFRRAAGGVRDAIGEFRNNFNNDPNRSAREAAQLQLLQQAVESGDEDLIMQAITNPMDAAGKAASLSGFSSSGNGLENLDPITEAYLMKIMELNGGSAAPIIVNALPQASPNGRPPANF